MVRYYMHPSIDWRRYQALLAILLIVLFANGYVFASTILVTTNNDVVDASEITPEGLLLDAGADGVVSLREAILAANSSVGADTISYRGTVTFVVKPEIPLPVLADPSGGTTIWGNYRLVLDGINCAGDNSGLVLKSAGNEILGLKIVRFSQHGIVVAGPDAKNNVIQACQIGTDGTLRLGNGLAGIRVEAGAENTLIGGTAEFHGNNVSGNGAAGIQIVGPETSGTTIQGNGVGITQGVGNSLSNFDRLEGEGFEVNVFGGIGIDIDGAKNTVVGSEIEYAGNVFSANNTEVLRVRGDGTQILGNLIVELPELDIAREIPAQLRRSAIRVFDSRQILIGGSTSEGNRITGIWQEDPVSVRRCLDVVITGNRILDDGQLSIASSNACIRVLDSTRVRVGGDSPSSINLLQGRSYSILMSNDGQYGNEVLGNTFEGYAIRALNVVYPTSSPPDFIGGEFPSAAASPCSTVSVHAGSVASIDQFLGSIAVDENGVADLLALPLETLESGTELFLTATDDLGNTSEFSGPFLLPEAIASPVEPPANVRIPGCIGAIFFCRC